MQTTEPGVVLFTPDGDARVINIETTEDYAEQTQILAAVLGYPVPDVEILHTKFSRLVYGPGTEPNPVLAGVLRHWLLWDPNDRRSRPLTGPVVLTGYQYEDDEGPLCNHRVQDLELIGDYWQMSRAALL